MRDALSLLDQVISACGDDASAEEVADALGAIDRRSVLELASALVHRRADQVVAILSEQYDRGADPRRLCEALCQELRNLLVCRLSGKAPAELPDHEQRQCEALSKEAEPPQLARLFELCHEMLGEMGRAFDPRLALEVALLKGIYLAPGASVIEGATRSRPRPLARSACRRRAEFGTPGGWTPVCRGKSLRHRRPELLSRLPPRSAPRRQGPGRGGCLPQARPGAGPVEVTREDLPAGRGATAIARVLHDSAAALKNGRLRLDPPAAGSPWPFPAGDFRGSQLLADKREVEKLLAAELGGQGGARDRGREFKRRTPNPWPTTETRGETARAERVRETTRSSSAAAVRDAVRTSSAGRWRRSACRPSARRADVDFDLGKLMEQAQRLTRDLQGRQEELGRREVEGQAGAGSGVPRSTAAATCCGCASTLQAVRAGSRVIRRWSKT